MASYSVEELQQLNEDFRKRCTREVEKRRDQLKIPNGPLEFVYG